MLRLAKGLCALASILLCAAFLPAHAADLRAVADTFVDGQASVRDTNLGALRTVRVRNSGPRIALIRFDNVPSPADLIPPVQLRLRVDTVNVPGNLVIQRVTSAWSESTVTWNSRPALDGQIWGSRAITAADVGKVVTIDITNLATFWSQQPSANFGLAIVNAVGSRAEVFFRARESGGAPILRLPERTSDNEATVGKTGADYTDPVTAANNAYEGDRWCEAPTDAAPCRIQLAPGVFILRETLVLPNLVHLVGAGRHQSLLVAARGLEVAVEVPAGSRIAVEDVAIVNSQTATARAFALSFARGAEGSKVSRVRIHSSGGTETAGIENRTTGITIADTEITAQGGQRAVGVLAQENIDQSNVYENLTVVATDATGENIGIEDHASYSAVLSGVNATAEGGTRAVGAAIGGSEDASAYITDSAFLARSEGEAVGLNVTSGAGGQITSIRAVAIGGISGEGMHLSASGNPSGSPVELRDLIASGTTTGLSIVRGTIGYTISGAHITSGGTAFLSNLTDEGREVPLIENSFFEAPVAIELRDGLVPHVTVDVRSTVLAGERRHGGGLSCTNVYDANYDLLTSCQ